jgi:hypothetical protein
MKYKIGKWYKVKPEYRWRFSVCERPHLVLKVHNKGDCSCFSDKEACKTCGGPIEILGLKGKYCWYGNDGEPYCEEISEIRNR